MNAAKGLKPVSLAFVTRKPPVWSTGSVETPAGSVRTAATALTKADRWGAVRSRISGFRMNYTVDPGLYAVGSPTQSSPVFVSANYKLSFDALRSSLAGIDGWIVVLDTKGINVWCAAGKGTFGTEELVRRVKTIGLDRVVTHRNLIVPQLGAPGVCATAVAKETGFRVLYGPVQAKDLKAYLDAGNKATSEMRRIPFPLVDRLVLTPMEINPAMKKFPVFAAIVLIAMGLQPRGVLFREAWQNGWPLLLQGLGSVLAGALITPALLPWVPGRSFAVKGWIAGLLTAAAIAYGAALPGGGLAGLMLALTLLFFPLLSSYIALQFTGSTTFTNMSGTMKELRMFLPIYLTGAAASVILVAVMKMKEWGLL
ncbi:MAG: mercury methylation corrinoid protein HgcA [Nitrospiraceae bacterium]|nr:mercury methylation corrinoid protein HgcA [Nitrospiraceae bacterium]